VRTMRTPQSRSATLPRNVANNSVPDIQLTFSKRMRRAFDSFAL
jgi:hypothetical protein